MTTPKSTLRRRRRTAPETDLPVRLVEWFRGDTLETPWEALIWPDYALLPERWQVWKAAHPNALPPAGFEWLEDPTSPQHPAPEQIERARELATRVTD